jgi:importin subunit alpha-6/7
MLDNLKHHGRNKGTDPGKFGFFNLHKKTCFWLRVESCIDTCGDVQAVIEADIIPPLVNLLATAEFDIKKEAAWAISNATSGGTQQQIQYLVRCGCIKPLCDLLVCSDVRIVTVALEGLENILKVELYSSC